MVRLRASCGEGPFGYQRNRLVSLMAVSCKSRECDPFTPGSGTQASGVCPRSRPANGGAGAAVGRSLRPTAHLPRARPPGQGSGKGRPTSGTGTGHFLESVCPHVLCEAWWVIFKEGADGWAGKASLRAGGQLCASVSLFHPHCISPMLFKGHRNVELRCGQGRGLGPHPLFLCSTGWQGGPLPQPRPPCRRGAETLVSIVRVRPELPVSSGFLA